MDLEENSSKILKKNPNLFPTLKITKKIFFCYFFYFQLSKKSLIVKYTNQPYKKLIRNPQKKIITNKKKT